jgi:acyl carrier protein
LACSLRIRNNRHDIQENQVTGIVISDELQTKVRVIVATVLEVEPEEITDGSSFVDDFEADSLLITEMFARFERDFGIKIPSEGMGELDSLPDACAVVARYSGEGAEAR